MKWTWILLLALASACGSVGTGEEAAEPEVEMATSESALSSAQYRIFVNGAAQAATASLCCTYPNGGSCGCGPNHPGCCSSACSCSSSPPSTATVLHVQTP